MPRAVLEPLGYEVDSFMQALMSRHHAVVYGDHRSEVAELCRLLSIRPVVPAARTDDHTVRAAAKGG